MQIVKNAISHRFRTCINPSYCPWFPEEPVSWAEPVCPPGWGVAARPWYERGGLAGAGDWDGVTGKCVWNENLSFFSHLWFRECPEIDEWAYCEHNFWYNAHDITASILLPVQQQPGDPERTGSDELYLSWQRTRSAVRGAVWVRSGKLSMRKK